MCLVSAVTDFYRGSWPQPGQVSISWEQYHEYTRLKKMAEELDQKLNQPDCFKPEVPEWEAELFKAVSSNAPPVEPAE